MVANGNGRPSFERGDKVRIVEGPYRGLEGLVDHITPRGVMRVIIPLNGRPARLELTHAQVRPL